MLADRLKSLRREYGLTQSDFAKLFDISLASIAMWESSSRQPPAKTLMRIADHFRVSIDYLLGGTAATESETILTLPVLAGVRAGFESTIEKIESGEYQEVPRSAIKNRRLEDLMVVKVDGDSMSPKFLDGDRVLVQKQPSVDSGDIAIVCYNGFENGTIKKVLFEHGCDYVDLIPLNPVFSPVRVSGEDLTGVRVVGKVVYLFREIA